MDNMDNKALLVVPKPDESIADVLAELVPFIKKREKDTGPIHFLEIRLDKTDGVVHESIRLERGNR